MPRKAHMKAKVAVATISGKAYFLIVDELKKRRQPFLSLVPGESIPAEAKVVITTSKEKHMINHERVVTFETENGVAASVNEALRMLNGKEMYEHAVIGIDPGKAFGVAVVADGHLLESQNCFSLKETTSKVAEIAKTLTAYSTSVSVKIGDGAPLFRKKLIKALDDALPMQVAIEIVSEAGTSRPYGTVGYKREVKDIASALRIAGRKGHVYHREKSVELDA